MTTQTRTYDLASLRYHATQGNTAPAEGAHRELHQRLSRMVNAAAAQARDLTADEQRVYDAGVSELTQIAEIRDLGDARRRSASQDRTRGVPGEGDDYFRQLAIIDLLNRKVSRTSFECDVATAITQGKREGLNRRTLTTSAGIRPTTIVPEIFSILTQNSAALDAGPEMFVTEHGEPLLLPRFTALSTAAKVSEGGTASFSDPTSSPVTLNAFKYAAFGKMTYEARTDATFDVMPFVDRQLAQAVGTAMANVLLNGTGTTEPLGLFAGGSVGVTGGTGVSGAPTADNLIELVYSVKSPYRNVEECVFIMNDTSLGVARKLKDTTNNYLLGTLADGSETILGYRVLTDNTAPNFATNKSSVYFGNVRRNFAVRMAGPMRIDLSTDFAFSSDEITFRAIQRLDSAILDADAGRLFKGGTA